MLRVHYAVLKIRTELGPVLPLCLNKHSRSSSRPSRTEVPRGLSPTPRCRQHRVVVNTTCRHRHRARALRYPTACPASLPLVPVVPCSARLRRTNPGNSGQSGRITSAPLGKQWTPRQTCAA
jgi:hypothetical protein